MYNDIIYNDSNILRRISHQINQSISLYVRKRCSLLNLLCFPKDYNLLNFSIFSNKFFFYFDKIFDINY